MCTEFLGALSKVYALSVILFAFGSHLVELNFLLNQRSRFTSDWALETIWFASTLSSLSPKIHEFGGE